MDYRGFGKSRGALSEQAMLSDALLIYEKAKETYHLKILSSTEDLLELESQLTSPLKNLTPLV